MLTTIFFSHIFRTLWTSLVPLDPCTYLNSLQVITEATFPFQFFKIFSRMIRSRTLGSSSGFLRCWLRLQILNTCLAPSAQILPGFRGYSYASIFQTFLDEPPPESINNERENPLQTRLAPRDSRDIYIFSISLRRKGHISCIYQVENKPTEFPAMPNKKSFVKI